MTDLLQNMAYHCIIAPSFDQIGMYLYSFNMVHCPSVRQRVNFKNTKLKLSIEGSTLDTTLQVLKFILIVAA